MAGWQRVGFLVLVVVTVPATAWSQRGSVSVGRVDDGRLVRGVRLPHRGPGWRVLPQLRARNRTFGTAQLVRGLRRVARSVSRRHRGTHLMLGDLSGRRGGPVSHHASHQSGRDVDVAFFAVDRRRRLQRLEKFMVFGRDLTSIHPRRRGRFDLARNWTTVESFVKDPALQVQFIFVAPHIKRELLRYARERRRPPWLRRRAARILRAEGLGRTHRDHFHVRVYCSSDDRPRCIDTGPVWPWIKR